MKAYIESQIDDLKQFVANLLPDYNDVSPSEAAYIVLLYDKIFRPNHSLWLMLAASTVKTKAGNNVAYDISQGEIKQNHDQLLLEVTKEAITFCTSYLQEKMATIYEDIDDMASSVAPHIRRLTCKANTLDGFFTIAAIENVLVPLASWMKELVQHRMISNSDMYFYYKGKHATAFTLACVEETELALYLVSTKDATNESIPGKKEEFEKSYKRSVEETVEDLKNIFSIILYCVKDKQFA